MVTHDRRFNRYASRTIDLLDGSLSETPTGVDDPATGRSDFAIIE